ncbi:MAG: GNAT family N-acetyltransferase [Lachnospiraceae bacterium]|nr:GNAT family N-acetyltransferase [Lachnospiraceae bacterium]
MENTKEIKRYENMVCPFDTALLKEDEYTFYVLGKILPYECRLTLTDHERFIACHSCFPFPVWVWLPKDAVESEKEQAWQFVKEHFLQEEGIRFNTKYFFAEYMIQRAKEEKIELEIAVNMMTYNCLQPIAPKRKAEGYVDVIAPEDKGALETALEFTREFHEELQLDQGDAEHYRKHVEGFANDRRLFFWRDGSGEAVAMCGYNVDGNKGSVTSVFTRKDKRRYGYAANLVHEITLRIKEKGLIPILYTDADYVASNACYESIGYRVQGNLWTVGKK